jgi:hypothetical protein
VPCCLHAGDQRARKARYQVGLHCRRPTARNRRGMNAQSLANEQPEMIPIHLPQTSSQGARRSRVDGNGPLIAGCD